MAKSLVPAAVFAGLLALAPCKAQDSVVQDIEVARAEFGKSISDADQVSETGTRFAPTDTVYLKVSLNSRPKTGVLSCKFYLDKQEITVASADLSRLDATGVAKDANAYGVFSLHPTAPFPISDQYRAEIFYDEKKLGTYPFQIIGEKGDRKDSDQPAMKLTDAAPVVSAGPTDIVAKLLHATANVTCSDDRDYHWTGTAWILDYEKRLLVTNDHVANAGAHDKKIGNVTSMKLYFPEYRDGRVIHDAGHYARNAEAINATVIYGDKARDLAIIQADRLPTDQTSALKLGSDAPSLGQRLHSLGGIPAGSEGYWIYTSGDVRAVYSRSMANGYNADVVEADMQTNKGNSGGPVVNDSGELVAVVEGHSTTARSVSLYIALSEVQAFLKDALPLVQPATAEQFMARAKHHRAAGRTDQALADFTQALRLDPNNAEVMALRGWVFYERDDLDTALTEFDDAIAADKTMLYAYHGRANVQFDLGEFDKALVDLTYAIKNAVDPKQSSEFYNERGIVYSHIDELDKALADFDRAVAADSSNAWAHANRGDMLAKSDQHLKAIDAIKTAVDLESKEPHFYWLMGKSAQAVDNLDGALKLFDIATALDGTNADYWISKARCLIATGDIQQATENLISAIEIDETDHRVYNEVGLVGFDLGNYPLAEAQFAIATQVDPGNYIYWLNRGHASLKLRKFDDAVAHLTQSISLVDDDADCYSIRGQARSALDRSNEAESDFRKAKELLPDAFVKYSSKLLKIANRTGEDLQVMVRYRVKGSDGQTRWYPPAGQAAVFEFAPGEASLLTFDGKQIHGDRFSIWAQGKESGKDYDEFKTRELISVGPSGYLSGSGEADIELYNFVSP
ncbi:serine protease [Stieleria varia]|uniref:Lipoprotein NlpI n=1 Tax=Stieleria varia TaxID=2528005 RepID=A0A5C5ZVG0_9BACT|nr:serine protease [Stieleria varia]TWT91309.1 lipoprotein NlpI [Stieleria varia]